MPIREPKSIYIVMAELIDEEDIRLDSWLVAAYEEYEAAVIHAKNANRWSKSIWNTPPDPCYTPPRIIATDGAKRWDPDMYRDGVRRCQASYSVTHLPVFYLHPF